ncbi:hypothetical protein GCM10028857_04470 [Salinarchaeum chitinilyticum]
MRFDRRATVAGVVLLGVTAVLLLDVFGIRSAVTAWLRVTEPATGTPAAMARTIARRADAVESLEAALATDPVLSLAVLATGIGVGLVGGSVVAFVHQRRRLRRGERDA